MFSILPDPHYYIMFPVILEGSLSPIHTNKCRLTPCLVQKTCPRRPSVLESAVGEATIRVHFEPQTSVRLLTMQVYQSAKPTLSYHTHTHTHTYLVLHSDLSSQCVICVPLLVEAQAQLLHLVFGLQAPWGLPCVCVTGARCVELLTGGSGSGEIISPAQSVSQTEHIMTDC